METETDPYIEIVHVGHDVLNYYDSASHYDDVDRTKARRIRKLYDEGKATPLVGFLEEPLEISNDRKIILGGKDKDLCIKARKRFLLESGHERVEIDSSITFSVFEAATRRGSQE